jgi:hypothetical protein
MGGSGGVIIVQNARKALSDPLVHGQLQTATQVLVDAVFDKDDADWTAKDREIIGKAFAWAIKNIL